MVVTGRRASNLPAELTRFIGRPELSQACGLLADARLVTLTGPGGVGKTRLALRIAAALADDFPDGVWLVDLAPLRDGSLLAPVIMATLEMREESTQDPALTLARYLYGKRTLLVLDNCEHLLNECAALASKLLTGTRGLRVLATSQQALGVKGERVFQVTPLPVPPPDQLPSMERVASFDAVRMFADRAVVSAPDFAVTEANYVAVARLCYLLDGLPLALELAANRLRILTVTEIADRLVDRFKLLARGFRTEDPRHRSLQAMMDWSYYELCTPDERALWERLSVFSGGFSLDAVIEVCADGSDNPYGLVEQIDSLIDKSIITGGPQRFGMLETIRQYGAERLAESGQGEPEKLKDLHLEYYRCAARKVDVEIFSPRQSYWLDWLRAEIHNIRAALNHCVSAPRHVSAGLEICAALNEGWLFEGLLGDGRLHLGRVLSGARDRSAVRVEAQVVAATLALWQGDAPAAERLVAEAGEDARALEDRYGLARTLHLRGAVALWGGDPGLASDLMGQVVPMYGEDCLDSSNLFVLTVHHALSCIAAGRADLALTLGARCTAMAERAKAEWSLGWALLVAGFARWQQGDMEAAATALRESLAVQRKIGDRWGPTWGAEVLAWTAAASGQHQHAAKLLGVTGGLRDHIDVATPGMLGPAHDRCERELRGALGDETFDRFYRQGATMTPAGALAYALDGRAEPAASPVPELTRREVEVADLVVMGRTNSEIADALEITIRTAETHVANVLRKLGLRKRSELGGPSQRWRA